MIFRSFRLSQFLPKIQTFSTVPDSYVKIVEVGPRDGLQNEPKLIPTDVKIKLIDKLSGTGLKSIEVTSFVSSKWVPQMGDNAEVFTGITKAKGVSYPVLVPNLKGLEMAVRKIFQFRRMLDVKVLIIGSRDVTEMKVNGIEEIAVFGSASDGFSKKNVNCTAEESLQRIKTLMDTAKKQNLKIRGYVSCVVGCPYDGPIKPSTVTKVTQALLEMGCYEVSLGDTIGVGTRNTITAMIKDLLQVTSADKLAIHCHDTYGQALVNIYTALEHGIRVVDSSVSGLGGCPYAKGATGNAATEDVVYMLHGMGMDTKIDLQKLVEAGNFISQAIGKSSESRAGKALYQKYKL